MHNSTPEYFKYSLFIFSVFFVISGYFLWQNWPSILLQAIQWQKQISTELNALLYDAQENPWSAGVPLIGLSFLYGLLHSLGPGHGKLIVSTYIATHPTKVKQSLMLTLLSGLLQAVVAIGLVSALLGIFNSSMKMVNSNANLFITISSYGVALLGFIIIIKSIMALYRLSPLYTVKMPSIRKITKLSHTFHRLQATNKQILLDSQCGCGHAHVADATRINQASSLKEYIMIVSSIGMRPCSGAIMVLMFSYIMNIYWLGIISAFAMAVGTVLTTSIIAMMTLSSKQLLTFYTDKNKRFTEKWTTVPLFVRLTAGIALMFMASLLINTATVTTRSPIF